MVLAMYPIVMITPQFGMFWLAVQAVLCVAILVLCGTAVIWWFDDVNKCA